MNIPGSPSSLRIKSLNKALRVLEAFHGRERWLNLSEIVEATGIEKSAVQRATYTLRENGYLEQDPKTRRFCLGRRVMDLSFQFLRTHPLIDRATPILVDLRRSTNERVDLSLVDGLSLLYVVRLQSKRETFFATLVGRRVPIFCTSGGRAILSRLDDAAAAAVIARSDRTPLTARTQTDPDRILQEVQIARERGYAVQVEECLPGEIALAAAVIDEEGAPIAAIHVAGLLSEWSREAFEANMAPLVTSAARAVSG